MYEVYLTDITIGQEARVADLVTLDRDDKAFDLCTALQPYLREGIEAHFSTR